MPISNERQAHPMFSERTLRKLDMQLGLTPRPERKRRTGPGREAAVQSAILHYCALKKIFAFRVNSMGTPKWDSMGRIVGFRPGATVGVSDLLGVVPDGTGRMLACEVKSPVGRITEAQGAFLEAVRAAGGVAFVARSLDDFIHNIELAVVKRG